MKLYLPVKDPINHSNPFGTPSPRYDTLGLKGHNGIDLSSPSGTKLYAPCDGLAQYVFDKFHGDGLWIKTTQAGQNYIVILYHLFPKDDPIHPFAVPTNGSHSLVKAGQFLGYTDNSGFPVESSGPHLHIGVIPCNPDWNPIAPNNGFHGCVDPIPYLNQLYAQDIPILDEAIKKSDEVVQLITSSQLPTPIKLSFLEKVAQFLRSLFK